MFNINHKIFIFCVSAFLFSACGGDNDSNPDISEWMSEHKDDIIFWSRSTNIERDYDFSDIHSENGFNFMFVKGNCEFWAYYGSAYDEDWNSLPADDTRRGRWMDIYTGTLPESECIQFQKDLKLGQNAYDCAVYDNCLKPDSVGEDVIISDADGSFRYGCGCPTKKCKKIYQKKNEWLQYMIENGTPYDGKLRGILVKVPESIQNIQRYYWTELPADFEKAVSSFSYDTAFQRGMTTIFPDEYQAPLKELREQWRQRNLKTTVPVYMQVIDSDGNKYYLSMRTSIPLEDEHGLIDPPEHCDQWNVVKSTMKYPR